MANTLPTFGVRDVLDSDVVEIGIEIEINIEIGKRGSRLSCFLFP